MADTIVGRQPGLNACQKVLLHHAISLPTTGMSIPVDQVLLLRPSWLLCSEAAWNSMESKYDALGRPSFRRKDRFWLAPDHLVDPRVNDEPRQRAIIDKCERIAKEMSLGDNYNPPNTTIMHTDFYRKRCQPGQLVIGADSHTGSAGALGALAIGMGVTDVLMQVVTGETYLKMPEVICIRLEGRPPPGLGGKDTIFSILSQLKRNTVAAERLVEFAGDGLKWLSCDARFAMCNMVTELGGIGALVVPDAITAEYIARRPEKRHKSGALYFKPDADALYAGVFTIDLSKLEHCVALYPSPDNVVPVSKAEAELPRLQGCFIGACTTTEEDLILAGLVLREGLEMGLKPVAAGVRRVTPGSIGITDRLRHLGLIDVYQEAGFAIGAPGCSYCIGMGIDKAGRGEVWLSSQNRNYQDRMGPGSIANLASAATVAASSFEMAVRSPQQLLSRIDFGEYNRLREYYSPDVAAAAQIHYSEPGLPGDNHNEREWKLKSEPSVAPGTAEASVLGQEPHATLLPQLIQGRVQRFGDNVDTDSIAPTEICLGMPTPEQLAQGAFCHTRPKFHELAKNGATVVVAGTAFGTGSSREQAPRVLLAAGIKVVVARSFAFIYGRNQANSGLLGVKVKADRFYELAEEGARVEVDTRKKVILCAGESFQFELDPIEEALIAAGGLLRMYDLHGTALFKHLQTSVSLTDGSDKGPSAMETLAGLTGKVGVVERGRLDW